MARIILDGDDRKALKYIDIMGTDVIIESKNKDYLKEWLELVQDTAPPDIIKKIKKAISDLEKSVL